MKVACVLLSDFEVAVELVRYPELANKPVIVGGLPHERKYVRSRSSEAAASGVAEGMPLREAQGLCPEAVFLQADDDLYRRALSRVLTTLDAFSPRVELASEQRTANGEQKRASERASKQGGPSTQHSGLPSVLGPQSSVLVFLDASGLEMLFGPDEELGERIAATLEARVRLRTRVGIASSKFTAQMAAMTAAPGKAVVVRPGEEKRFLAPLPVEWIPCSDEMRRRLDLFGLRTMEQLAALPRGALGEQFGPEGVEAARLARGIDQHPVLQRDIPHVLSEEAEIDPATGDNHILVIVARRLAERLERQLKSSFVACQNVSLYLGFENGAEVRLSTVLHEPTDDAVDLLRAVERLLGRAYLRVGDGGTGGQRDGEKQGWRQGESERGIAGVNRDAVGLNRLETRFLEVDATQGISIPHALTPSLHHSASPRLPVPASPTLPLISMIRLSLSGFGNSSGEQLELMPTQAGGIKRIRQAVRQAEELFGKDAIHSLGKVVQGRVSGNRVNAIAESDGRPRVLFIGNRAEKVREISNRWRVQEEWWRREVLREYYRVITETGKLCLVYQDLLGGAWYVERIYG